MLAAAFLSSYRGGMTLHINEALAVGELRETSKRSRAFSKVQTGRETVAAQCVELLYTSSDQNMPFSFHFM